MIDILHGPMLHGHEADSDGNLDLFIVVIVLADTDIFAEPVDDLIYNIGFAINSTCSGLSVYI